MYLAQLSQCRSVDVNQWPLNHESMTETIYLSNNFTKAMNEINQAGLIKTMWNWVFCSALQYSTAKI